MQKETTEKCCKGYIILDIQSENKLPKKLPIFIAQIL
jgi:hypothetical protein